MEVTLVAAIYVGLSMASTEVTRGTATRVASPKRVNSKPLP